MTPELRRELLDERFGPVAEVERERTARPSRVLADFGDVFPRVPGTAGHFRLGHAARDRFGDGRVQLSAALLERLFGASEASGGVIKGAGHVGEFDTG